MALLREITKARIACANSFHEFDTLGNIVGEWTTAGDETLETTALDIQLFCESGAKEAHTVLDILTGFLTNSAAPEWLWMEAEIRRENSVGAADDVIRLIEQLASAGASPELSLRELSRRATMIKTKLDGLKGMLEQLRAEMQRQAQGGQQRVQNGNNGPS